MLRKKLAKKSLANFNYWQEKKVGAILPRTVKNALGKDKSKNLASQDCCADPCKCTGCSEWD